MFSKSCEYGIKATIYIVGQSINNRKVGLKEVAEEIDSPVAYTSKILQKLSKSNIILSDKGPTGGFYIDPTKAKEINLAEIVSTIDGEENYKDCALGLNKCNELKPCPLHFKFKVVRTELHSMLSKTSILELYQKIDDGTGFLKR